jgi:uncharacterized membrane protein
MTRESFLAALRGGLAGLPQYQIDDALADYQSHFNEGIADGRSEEEIAAALGDPVRLAREVRAEAGFRRWESSRSAGSLAGVMMGLLGLAAIDVVFMLPFMFVIAGILFAVGIGVIAAFVVGVALSLFSLFPGMAWFGLTGNLGGALASLLAGLGLIFGGIGFGCWCVMRGCISA